MDTSILQEYEGSFGKGRTVHDIVDCVESLPPMPDVIARALQLVDDLDATPEQMAEVIMCDQTLASSILRMANSAGFGQQREVTTLASAIMLVGLRQLKSLLLASALQGMNRAFGPLERLIWEKSIGAASAAHVLCAQLKKRYRDEIYLTALLHNLGQVVFLANPEIAQIYPGVLERIRETGESYALAEREVIGFSHPLVGALVARKWKLPLATCQAVLHYADPLEESFGDPDEKLSMLKLVTELGMGAGLGRPEGFEPNAQELSALARAVGWTEAELDTEYFEEAQREIKARFAAEASVYPCYDKYLQAA